MITSESNPATLGSRPNGRKLHYAAPVLLLLFSLFLAPSALRAQSYLVTSVEGNVRLVKNGKSVAVKPRFKLDASSLLSIGTGSEVGILQLDETKKYYTLSTPCKKTLASFLKDKQTRWIVCTKTFLRYLRDEILHGDKVVENTTMGGVAATYRDADSLMMEMNEISLEPEDSAFTEDAE